MAGTIFLFQSCDSDYYALSRDQTGCNIPPLGRRRWLLRAEIEPEDIEADLIRAVEMMHARGYCIMLQTDVDRQLAS
jgi:hypothetical protein